ncbi:MAG TPA: hypothetical protein VFA11_10140 [Acidimicrobiales bacterium]|nr:hypothetical protein [Acidimicrobiales bacterium]
MPASSATTRLTVAGADDMVDLSLEAADAFLLTGIIQLALKHPQVGDYVRDPAARSPRATTGRCPPAR